MREAAIAQDVAQWVGSEGALAALEGHAHVEAGELAAAKGVCEVGGREAQAGGGLAHPPRLGDMGGGLGPLADEDRVPRS